MSAPRDVLSWFTLAWTVVASAFAVAVVALLIVFGWSMLPALAPAFVAAVLAFVALDLDRERRR